MSVINKTNAGVKEIVRESLVSAIYKDCKRLLSSSGLHADCLLTQRKDFRKSYLDNLESYKVVLDNSLELLLIHLDVKTKIICFSFKCSRTQTYHEFLVDKAKLSNQPIVFFSQTISI